jgi:site-specific DNA recombinase
MELAKIADSIERFCEQVSSGLANATFEQKRALVELLIDQVVVTDEEVEIRYVVPTLPEGPHLPFCHLRSDYLLPLPQVAPRRPAQASARSAA